MSWHRRSFLQALGTAALGVSVVGSSAAPANETVVGPLRWEDAETAWSQVRAQYRLQPGLTYLNTGGLGPAPVGVQRTATEVAAALQRTVETGHARFAEAREVLARFLGVRPEEVAFVRNATEANGIIAAGLPLVAGDEVIFETHAHPGGSFSWLQLARQRGIVVRLFEPDPTSVAGNVARIQALLTPRTRVVQVSHVTAPSGIVLPVRALAELCRPRGIWLHVDGAQSLGMFPFSVTELGCDSYASSGHKWLGAPHETGLLVVRRERLEDVAPSIIGAHSGELDQLPGVPHLAPSAARFEYGSRSAASVVALAAAAQWQDEVGRDRIMSHGRALVARLRAGLPTIPDVEVLTPDRPELAAAMLTFRTSRLRYDVLFQRLFAKYQLRCRPVSEQHLDAVRVSCHLFNTTHEIDRLLEAVDQLVRSA